MLQVIGIVDVSYKCDDMSVGGMVFMIADKDLKRASPIMLKSKQKYRV